MPMKQHPLGPVVVWSAGNTTTSSPDSRVFHPIGPILETSRVGTVRTAVEMAQSSGMIRIEAGYALSNDGKNWEDAVSLTNGAYVEADGEDFATDWDDIATAIKAFVFIRFGVRVRNTSGSKIECCNVYFRVDVREP